MPQRRILFKSIQRRIYDLLLTRYGVLAVLGALVVLLVCVLQLSDTILEYRLAQIRRLANVITLQNASISLSISYFGDEDHHQFDSDEPIDVVFTWVNGSDPAHLASIRAHRNTSYSARLIEVGEYLPAVNDGNSDPPPQSPCYHKLCVQTARVVVCVPALDQVAKKSLLAKTPLVQLEQYSKVTVIYLTNHTQLAQIHATLSNRLGYNILIGLNSDFRVKEFFINFRIITLGNYLKF